MRAAPPTLPADTPASRIYQDRDQLANARVAEADAPSHHYNRGKPQKLLGTQQGGIIGIASSRSQRDEIYDSHTNNFAKG